jgi:hypothetical protein
MFKDLSSLKEHLVIYIYIYTYLGSVRRLYSILMPVLQNQQLLALNSTSSRFLNKSKVQQLEPFLHLTIARSFSLPMKDKMQRTMKLKIGDIGSHGK